MRLQLQSALDFVRDGDVFVVTKLDRLARSVGDLMAILQALERKHDGGATWTPQMPEADPVQALLGVAFPDISHGRLVGLSGTILAVGPQSS